MSRELGKLVKAWRKLALSPVWHPDGVCLPTLFSISMAYQLGKPGLGGEMAPNWERDRAWHVDQAKARFAELTDEDEKFALRLYAAELQVPLG